MNVITYLSKCKEQNIKPDPRRLGTTGEHLFSFMFSYFDHFDVYFMGDRAPVVDFMLEIADEKEPYQCMVQVKSTSKGIDEEGRLLAKLTEKDKKKLLKRPLPTYLVGVDLQTLEMYLCPVFDKSVKYSSHIESKCIFSMRDENLWLKAMVSLKEDIINYWETIDLHNIKSNFSSKLYERFNK